MLYKLYPMIYNFSSGYTPNRYVSFCLCTNAQSSCIHNSDTGNNLNVYYEWNGYIMKYSFNEYYTTMKKNKFLLYRHNIEQARPKRVNTVKVNLQKVWAQTKLLSYDRGWYLTREQYWLGKTEAFWGAIFELGYIIINRAYPHLICEF